MRVHVLEIVKNTGVIFKEVQLHVYPNCKEFKGFVVSQSTVTVGLLFESMVRHQAVL